MIKRFYKLLPSHLIKEMYKLLSILLHLNIHKCEFAFMTSFPYSLVLDPYSLVLDSYIPL